MKRFIAFLAIFLLIGCAQEVKLPSIGGHITEENIDQIVMTGSGEGASALLLNPSSNNTCYTTSLNNSDCYDDIVKMQRENGNVSRLTSGIVAAPWLDSSTACGVVNIKNGSSCNIAPGAFTFAQYCQVSDEHSVQAMNLAVSNNITMWDGIYNFLNNSQSFSVFGRLPGWRCVINETAGNWDCHRAGVNGNGDSASDADARYIIATYAASVNPLFPSTNQSLYRALGDALIVDFVRYDLRYQCTNSTLGNGPICWWQASGGNASNGGFSWGDFYYSGYNQDSILALYAAANSTGNTTYIAIAQNLTQGYLQLSNWTGAGFRVPPGRSGHIVLTTVGGQANVPIADCDNTCNPDVWDTADAPRAHGWGWAQFVATNLTGIPLLNMTTYLTQWNIAVLSNNNNSIPISYHSNGTFSGSNQSGYLAQGWQSEALAYGNQSKFQESLKNAIAHISGSTRTPDSAACFGTYNEGPMMRSYAFGLGRYNAMYTRTSSSSSNTTQTAFSGPINVTIHSPSNGSASLQNSVYFNLTVWNLNNSQVSGGAGTGNWSVLGVDDFTSSKNWSGGTLDTTAGKYNITAFGTARKQYNQTGYSTSLPNCTVANFTIGSYSYVDGANDGKVFVPGDTASDNDYLLFDGTQPTIDWKHVDDGGSFGTCNLGISGSVTWVNGSSVSIVRNTSSGVWTTYYNGLSCRSETSTLVNGTNFEVTAGNGVVTIDDVSYACWNETGGTSLIPGNSSMNVTLYWANGTIIQQWNNTPNATNLAYNLTNVANGNYSWYVTVRSRDNVVNYTGLNYSVSAPSVVSTNVSLCANMSTPLWNANLSRGRYDPKTRTYNESFILPVNNSLCGYTYKLNNTLGAGSSVIIFTTNYTNPSGNLTMFVNGTMINASSSKSFTVPVGQVYYINVSINLTRWPVLQSEPSVSLGVGV